MASGIYQRFFANLMNKAIDLEADTIKIMLLDNVHVFDSADNILTDVSDNEITGAGYVAGGQALLSKLVTQGIPTFWSANNVTWTDSSFSAYHGILYDANNNLIASIDFGGEVAIADGTIEIQWNVLGIITLSE